MSTRRAITIALCALGISVGAHAQNKNNAPYEIARDWPALAHPYSRPGYVLGSQGGIFAESPDRIFLANRGELKLPEKLPETFNGFWGSLAAPGVQPNANIQLPEMRNAVMVVDGRGRLIESWTQWDHLFADGRGPHSIRISAHDPDRHVWVIDDYHHQIFKFTNDGKSLVMTLGERGVGGDDATHFRRPTDIDWLPDGTFFVSDGYGNTRIAKFDRNGNFLTSWGTRGKAPGQLDTPHGIAVGPDRRVYVSDRSNKRIQVFDENGAFIAEWPKIMAQTVLISDKGHLWLYDSDRNLYVEYDPSGKELSSFHLDDTFTHQLSADSDGNIYGAGSRHGQPLKLVPKRGADKARLLRPMPLSGKPASTAPGKITYTGAWKLAAAEPPGRAAGTEAFAGVLPDLSFTLDGTRLKVAGGGRHLNFDMSGAATPNMHDVDKTNGTHAVTTARWRDGKLILMVKQGLNVQKDTITAQDNTLAINRDVNLAGTSYVVDLKYARP